MYYCFLCNTEHEGEPTREHFLPRSVDAPSAQWLPVCAQMNARSNMLLDSGARDLLYLERFSRTKDLKRVGEAVLADGSVKPFRFNYRERIDNGQVKSDFAYIRAANSGAAIPTKEVYAIRFFMGLSEEERQVYVRWIAKITLGAIVFLLQSESVPQPKVTRLVSHPKYSAMRRRALRIEDRDGSVQIGFQLGYNSLLERLQATCASQSHRNHVVQISVRESTVRVEGMLYSQYGWKIPLPNTERIPSGVMRIENEVSAMLAPDPLRDTVLSSASICIINPDFRGPPPEVPSRWQGRD